MYTSSTISAILLFSGLLSCNNPRTQDITAAKSALQKADSGYSAAGKSKSFEDFLAFYASNSVAYPPGEAIANGLPAVRSLLEPFFKDSLFTVTFHPVLVEVSGDGSMGYTMNNASLTYTGPDGKALTEQIRDFHIWRRQDDGSWKLTVDIWNIEPTPGKP